MAKKRANKTAPEQAVIDYRHEDAKRKNIPPAGLAAERKFPRSFKSFPYQKAGLHILFMERSQQYDYMKRIFTDHIARR